MATFFLDDCPQYTALSYTWALNNAHRWNLVDAERLMTLNGKTKLIKQNLAVFLDQVKPDFVLQGIQNSTSPATDRVDDEPPGPLSQEVGFIWVDALCINQESIPERNAQVALMHRIYAEAVRIVIWLGPGDPRSDLALKMYQRLGAPASGMNYASTIRLSPEEKAALADLAVREWWQRVWVWQEATTPSVARELWCGNHRIRFEDAQYVNALLYNRFMSQPTAPDIVLYWNRALDEMGKLHLLREVGMWGHTGEIDLLEMMTHLKATDERDKVFAFLPLFQEFGSNAEGPPHADYGLTASEVFHQATMFLLEARRDLRILLLCSHGRQTAEFSWVPSFSPLENNAADHYFREHSLYAADGRSQPQLSFADGRRELHVRGIEVDEIVAVYPPWLGPGDLISTILDAELLKSSFDAWLTGLAKFAFPDGKDEVYVNGGSTSDALDRMLVQYQPHAVRRVLGNHENFDNSDSPRWKLADIASGSKTAPEFSFDNLQTTTAWARNRHAAVFRTRRGYFGTVGGLPELGAMVAVFFGLRVPMVLRPSQRGLWKIFGPCYVPGIMEGEAVEKAGEQEFMIC